MPHILTYSAILILVNNSYLVFKMITKRYLTIVTAVLYTALMCAPVMVQADEHHHDHDHGQMDFGIYFGPSYSPYYYPYSPYYYPYPERYIYVRESKPVVKDAGVMRAQVELMDKGFYKGDIDGILGPQTKAAIIDFQKSKNLPQTGALDDATLTALGIKK